MRSDTELAGNSFTAKLLSTLVLLLLGLIYFYLVKPFWYPPEFPIINKYSRDWTGKKANAAFVRDARGLIHEGFRRFQGPFSVATPSGPRVILPTEYAEWIRKSPDVSHQAFTAKEFFAGYPGFEGETAVADPSELLINVVKTKLSQNKFVERLENGASQYLEEVWQEPQEWRDVKWAHEGTHLIGRLSASVFVGEGLAGNPEWLQISIDYAVNMFFAARALRCWPTWIRPIVHWIIPECRRCRIEVQKARQLLREIIRQRSEQTQRYEDAITWMNEAAAGRKYDVVGAQLGLAMAANVTTAELLKQTLISICSQPELISPLRAELDTAIADHSWSAAGLFNMRLLDSVIKETQRLYPLGEVNLERQVIRNTTLPNGQLLRRGTNIAVDTKRFLDRDVYEDPTKFDGHRFLKLQEKGGKWKSAASVVSTSPDHFVFGMGKFICPGRFLAAAEVKTALAVILRDYDVRLHPDYTPTVMRHGFEVLVDPAVRLQVKKR